MMGISKPPVPSQGPKAMHLVAMVLVCCMAVDAGARTAECFTTDDGTYPCEFEMTDAQGSFVISAAGKPTYILDISEPAIAFGYVNLGQRNVPLPGRYLRSTSDPACWVNDSTETRICVR
jgi:hypothetical protein